MNSVGLQNPGVDAVLAEELPWLADHFHGPLIANVGGFSLEEYAENAAFNCTVRSEDLQTVLKELNDASNGRISVEDLGHIRFLDKEEREI